MCVNECTQETCSRAAGGCCCLQVSFADSEKTECQTTERERLQTPPTDGAAECLWMHRLCCCFQLFNKFGTEFVFSYCTWTVTAAVGLHKDTLYSFTRVCSLLMLREQYKWSLISALWLRHGLSLQLSERTMWTEDRCGCSVNSCINLHPANASGSSCSDIQRLSR